MFKLIKDQKGIALVTALMLTLISLTIVVGLLYLMTQSTQLSGAQKRYRTALEASYGGSEVVVKEIIPQIFQNISGNSLASSFAAIGLQVTATGTCLQQKLRAPTTQWNSACSQTLNPKQFPDLTFTLLGTGAQSFTVMAKVVDTKSGNTDTSGLTLEGAGVAEATLIQPPPADPNVYRIEIQAEKTQNATEQANLSVLYAY